MAQNTEILRERNGADTKQAKMGPPGEGETPQWLQVAWPLSGPTSGHEATLNRQPPLCGLCSRGSCFWEHQPPL